MKSKLVAFGAVSLLVLSSASCARGTSPPPPPPAPAGRIVICAGDDLRDFLPSVAASSSVATRLGGPSAMPAGTCPTIPPCYANGSVLSCRSDVIANILRNAAALALERVTVLADAPADLPDHAISRADLAGAGSSDAIDRALTLATANPAPTSPTDVRVATLTRRIADMPLTFLMGHELYHLRGSACRAPLDERLHNRVGEMTKLDLGAKLFCKGNLDLGELQADECAYAELQRMPRAPLDGEDATYATLAGAALSTWFVLRGFERVPAGKLPTLTPMGYLRGPLRSLLLASLVAPSRDQGRACGESAKLIVTAMQEETRRCEREGREWGGDVPDGVLALLPPRVADAWSGRRAWDGETFRCD